MENNSSESIIWAKLIIEFVGTFFLVTVVLLYGSSIYGAFVIGMTLAVAIFFGGYMTTGCFNPAVTLGNYLNNSLTGIETLSFIIIQFLAAVAAYYFFTNNKSYGYNAHIESS